MAPLNMFRLNLRMQGDFEAEQPENVSSYGQTGVVNEVGLGRPTMKSFTNGGDGLGLVRSTSFGRKRVSISMDNVAEVEPLNSVESILNKKDWSAAAAAAAEDSFFPAAKKCGISSLPDHILIYILDFVDHADLENLLLVSKSIRQTTLIAKKKHFAYRTPTKGLIRPFRSAVAGEDGVENFNIFNEDEPAGCLAPKRQKVSKSRITDDKAVAHISVALFPSKGANWPRKERKNTRTVGTH